MDTLDPQEAFRPNSGHFGDMVTPVAQIVADKCDVDAVMDRIGLLNAATIPMDVDPEC